MVFYTHLYLLLLYYKIPREKFEPELWFELRTSGFLARLSTTWAILVLMPAHVQISLLRRMPLIPGGAVMTLSSMSPWCGEVYVSGDRVFHATWWWELWWMGVWTLRSTPFMQLVLILPSRHLSSSARKCPYTLKVTLCLYDLLLASLASKLNRSLSNYPFKIH